MDEKNQEHVEIEEETLEDSVYDAHHRLNVLIQLLIEKRVISEEELEAVGERLESEEETDEE
jgi:hypothetical protein